MRLSGSVRSTALWIAMSMAAGSSQAAAPASTVPTAAAGESAPAASYVLPGRFTPDQTIDDLKRLLGAPNVQAMQLDGAEGEVFDGIVLFDADPQRRAEIFPRDSGTLSGIESIRISGSTSAWQADNGVRLGMTLDELVALNGKPITFSGLDWDYGGGVLDWHGGRLAPRDDDAVFRAVTLAHDSDASDGSIPMGDGDFLSSDAAYPKQGTTLFVGKIVVSFITPEAP